MTGASISGKSPAGPRPLLNRGSMPHLETHRDERAPEPRRDQTDGLDLITCVGAKAVVDAHHADRPRMDRHQGVQ